MKKITNAKLTLMGAGPGDIDLITIKGKNALQAADVILYDALANPTLLNYAPKGTLKVYVGKRANKHRYTQAEINQLAVQYAYTHGHVVRLKGGDPFIFGRGHEELTYANALGIATEVVPGISSSTALSGLQQVPLTHRAISHGFWVLTGTTKDKQLPKDFYLAAQSDTTIVILMGLRKLPEITTILKEYDKAKTPVMVIQNGSLPNEKVALGTVDTIVDEVKRKEITTPAIIVVGEVVKLHPALAYDYAAKQLN